MRRGRGTWYSVPTAAATPCRGSRGATPNTGPRASPTRTWARGNPSRAAHSPANKRCEVAQVAQRKLEVPEGRHTGRLGLLPGETLAAKRKGRKRDGSARGGRIRDAASAVARRGAECPSSTVPSLRRAAGRYAVRGGVSVAGDGVWVRRNMRAKSRSSIDTDSLLFHGSQAETKSGWRVGGWAFSESQTDTCAHCDDDCLHKNKHKTILARSTADSPARSPS